MALVGVLGGLVLYNLAAAVSSWWLGYWADNSGSDNDDMVDDAEVTAPPILMFCMPTSSFDAYFKLFLFYPCNCVAFQ
jgi:hypothetical protein